jgi:glyoxylase-like metal-dependent hydrolase (beta-lactamase superfamily II)
MLAMSETYEVHAIQYAQVTRDSRDFFLAGDPHEAPRAMFYFVWVLRNADRVIVVDSGFDAERARRRGREFLRCPTEGMRILGIDPEAVDTVIVTHLHYDHAGNFDKFPRAKFILQDEEMSFATGRAMRFAPMRAPYELDDVLAMVSRNYAGRVHFVSGSETIAPGITVHHMPGHTKGLQAVTVETARGRVCLASDAAHFYDNIVRENVFPVVADVVETFEGHEGVLRLADSPDHLIPGHDPLVMDLFPRHPQDPLICDLSQPPVRPSPLAARS